MTHQSDQVFEPENLELKTIGIVFDENIVKKDLKVWAISLIGVGLLSLIFSGYLSFVWGCSLILLGIIMFFTLEPAYYLVLGTVILLLGFKNVLAGESFWSVYSFIQFLVGFWLIFEFKRHYKFYNEGSFEKKFLTRFSIIFTFISVLLFGINTYLYLAKTWIIIPVEINFGFDISWNLAILGVAFAMAGLFTEKQKAFPLVSLFFGIIIFLICLFITCQKFLI